MSLLLYFQLFLLNYSIYLKLFYSHISKYFSHLQFLQIIFYLLEIPFQLLISQFVFLQQNQDLSHQNQVLLLSCSNLSHLQNMFEAILLHLSYSSKFLYKFLQTILYLPLSDLLLIAVLQFESNRYFFHYIFSAIPHKHLQYQLNILFSLYFQLF